MNSIDDFRFDLAIAGNQGEMMKRKQLAEALFNNGDAIVLLANLKKVVCAGIFLVLDRGRVYLLHSWRGDEAPRGTVSLLILRAIEWAFNNGYKYFDFEGSVIQSIDNFFLGFNAKITAYGYVHWSRNRNRLHHLIDTSINIEGRLIL